MKIEDHRYDNKDKSIVVLADDGSVFVRYIWIPEDELLLDAEEQPVLGEDKQPIILREKSTLEDAVTVINDRLRSFCGETLNPSEAAEIDAVRADIQALK